MPTRSHDIDAEHDQDMSEDVTSVPGARTKLCSGSDT